MFFLSTSIPMSGQMTLGHWNSNRNTGCPNNYHLTPYLQLLVPHQNEPMSRERVPITVDARTDGWDSRIWILSSRVGIYLILTNDLMSSSPLLTVQDMQIKFLRQGIYLAGISVKLFGPQSWQMTHIQDEFAAPPVWHLDW